MASQTPSASQVPANQAVILAATDFSETANSALDWAVELARQQGAHLELVHAITIPPALPGYLPPTSLDFSEELRKAAETRLTQTGGALPGKRKDNAAIPYPRPPPPTHLRTARLPTPPAT